VAVLLVAEGDAGAGAASQNRQGAVEKREPRSKATKRDDCLFRVMTRTAETINAAQAGFFFVLSIRYRQ
jgi:hypothetical protein